MPGWHEATSELRASGMLDSLGVVVEQHPERARLFMQWKEMDWPLLWDPFNLLELPAVPVTVILDPDGVVQLVQPRLEQVASIARLVAEAGWPPPDDVGRSLPSPVPSPRFVVSSPTSMTEWSDRAVALALWGGAERLDDAVEAADRLVKEGDGTAWFRRGVILRLRHDSARRRATDTALATEAWTRALEFDPANYIRRRRLQQYGPRLAKPYAFYDWVREAREVVEARGDVPVALRTEPEGAEFSGPTESPRVAPTPIPPLPDHRIPHDDEGRIEVRTHVVPSSVRPGDAVRIHVDLVPADTHWNNEAGPLASWLRTPDGWESSPSYEELDVPSAPSSSEHRHLEFEVRVSAGAPPSLAALELTLAYNICDDETAMCLFRRRTVAVRVPVDEAAVGLRD